MKRPTLSEIADLMYTTAQRTGEAHRTLGGGLQLNLYRSTTIDGTRWMLVLSRADVVPSAQEVVTVRRDFRVPGRAEQIATNRVVSLTWLDAATVQVEQASLWESAA